MCGIAGIIRLGAAPLTIEERQDLASVTAALKHRGPDGEGIFFLENVGMGHQRLAIIDPEHGQQPFLSDDGKILLSYNGEIYNYQELRKELSSDFKFRTDSDTEVLMRAYEKWGIQCLERFRGMFVFALYDSRIHRAFLVRDRAGIKPLYYYQHKDRLFFASELQALLKSSSLQRDIDPQALAEFFRYQYVPTPATIYRNLFKLEPAHYLRVDTRSGEIQKIKYWDLPSGPARQQSEAAWLEELNNLLEETIRIYVRSDVPFGVFLSGGVDSSLVAALMSPHVTPLKTFSIGFDEAQYSELPFAKRASGRIRSEHYEKVVTAKMAEEALPSLASHFGEPFADSSAIPTFCVSKEASSRVKMVLSGDGGDELFGGYNSYQQTFLNFESRSSGTRLLFKNWFSPKSGKEKWKSYQEDHDAQRQIFRTDALEQLFRAEIPKSHTPMAVLEQAAYEDPVAHFQAQDFKTYLLDDILTKVDRMSMANSLEVRVPFLDHKVIELAFSLPLNLKLRKTAASGKVCAKYLLKKSAARFYPDSFLQRPKQGFGIPITEWCRGPLRKTIESGLREKDNGIYDWLEYKAVQKLLDDLFLKHQSSLTNKVWFIFMFDLWFRHVHQSSRP